ncbi:hypothetical protein SELMODRAFT_122175 [Selaginella moellendorffii]|uniref:Calcium-transporting ATPase n=1 Tax=Selaginella moellendorffii TaxID=88036 RepID=D8SPR5_SELML|nr:hypothetical protein SELMODRAFT_122175 [Selaginella moellendorffii]
MDDAHARSVSQVLAYFRVDPSHGLADSQVEEARSLYGCNGMLQIAGASFWKLVLKQFDDLLVKILIFAAITSLVLAVVDGETGFTAFVEPFVILLILAANATVGVVTETNAEKALKELKAYQADVATVLRNGLLSIVPASNLVPGDIVEVAVGCKVPADMRVIDMLSSSALRVDQAILTGESSSVAKELEENPVINPVYQDKTSILFSGTNVTAGRARAIVVATGSETAMGKIHSAMSEVTEEMTPLKKQLDNFGEFLSKVIAGICVLVWVVNIGHFRDPAHGGILRGAIYYLKIAVALAVAAIPEGLPAVVTTCLALGTKRMASLNAIVRSLPAVETLGCTTVICSDKTGTLTTNMMSVTKICVVESAATLSEFTVTGTSYAPDGVIQNANNQQIDYPAALPSLVQAAICSSLCNDCSIQYNAEKDIYEKIGESTEVALRVFSEKVGLPGFDSMPTSLSVLSKQERVSYCNRYWERYLKKAFVLEFSHDRKMMSVLCSNDERTVLLSKGAPEVILQRSSYVVCNQDGSVTKLSPELKLSLEEKFHRQDLISLDAFFASQETLRCIALAYKDVPTGQQTLTEDDENGLILIGMVGMMDPPRPEVKAAIATCKSAGIRVVVITGDNKKTAEALCHRIGVFDKSDDVSSKSLTAAEFDSLTPMQQAVAVQNLVLFSRVNPSHKSMLVDVLKRHKEVVAMTGDGVNDAPALKQADIGIAMGSGTAVAKGASDMVLADDNFATVVAAVAEGRAIYNNTKQFIRYMISSNIGEVVCIFVAAALGLPETLIPVQLLWVNLVTDGLPATALGFNKQDRNVMMAKPRKMDEAIVNGWLFFRYMVVGAYVGLATVGGFIWWFLYHEEGPRLTWKELVSFNECKDGTMRYSCSVFRDRHPSTISMSVLVVVEMFNAMNNLSENQSLLVLPPWSNMWLMASIGVSMLLHFLILYLRPLSLLFSVTPLSWAEWKAVLWFSFPVILVDEVLKVLSRQTRGKPLEFFSYLALPDFSSPFQLGNLD